MQALAASQCQLHAPECEPGVVRAQLRARQARGGRGAFDGGGGRTAAAAARRFAAARLAALLGVVPSVDAERGARDDSSLCAPACVCWRV